MYFKLSELDINNQTFYEIKRFKIQSILKCLYLAQKRFNFLVKLVLSLLTSVSDLWWKFQNVSYINFSIFTYNLIIKVDLIKILFMAHFTFFTHLSVVFPKYLKTNREYKKMLCLKYQHKIKCVTY